MAATTGPSLWPGSATFPNTNVYPGQDRLPLHRVMVSHSDYAVSTPVWTDYSDRVRSLAVSRGRNSELDNFDAGAATVVFDNRDRALDPVRANLCTNPSFEVDVNGWVSFVNTGATVNDFSQSPVWASHGNFSAHFKWTNGTAVLRFGEMFQPYNQDPGRMPIIVGKTYSAQADVNLVALPADSSVQMQVAFYDGSSNQIGGFGSAQISGTGVKHVTVSGATAPAGAVYAIIIFVNSTSLASAVSEYYVDSVQFEEGATTSAYFDVSTPRPMNRVWVYAEFSGVREDLFRGYAEAWQASWDRSGVVDAVATLRATDEFKVLNLVNVPASGTPPNSGGTAAAIVGDVLDTVANRAPRNLLVNEYAVTGYTYAGQSALGDIGAVALSGAVSPALFVGRDGTIQLIARGSTPLATFGDGGGTELPYLDCQLDYTDSFLFNTWTVTGTSSTSATATDATSVGQFGKRENSRAVLWDAASGGFGATLAGSLVANYKNPFQRVISVKPNMANIDVCQQTLARELIDRIRLLRTPPGGGARIDEQLFIQRVDYAAEPGVPPDVQLGVSPL